MSIRQKKLKDMCRTVTIPFDGDDLHVTYRLTGMSTKTLDWVDEHGNERKSIHQWLERVIVEWDFLYDDGSPLPVTVAAMEEYDIPISFLVLIKLAIQEDSSPLALRESYKSGSRSDLAAALNGTP